MNPATDPCTESIPERSVAWIEYHRLDMKCSGEIKNELPVLEPVLRPGLARLVNPSPGACVRGTLVDCPEGSTGVGCVVVDTDGEAVAVQSPALSCLVVEHAPCCLEFIAVALRNSDGQVFWDWEAYELSPYGARILVSHSHEESRKETADQSLNDT